MNNFRARRFPLEARDVTESSGALQLRKAFHRCVKYIIPPLNIKLGDIRVRSLPFSVDGNLDQAGQAFVQDVLQSTFAETFGYMNPSPLTEILANDT